MCIRHVNSRLDDHITLSWQFFITPNYCIIKFIDGGNKKSLKRQVEISYGYGVSVDIQLSKTAKNSSTIRISWQAGWRVVSLDRDISVKKKKQKNKITIFKDIRLPAVWPLHNKPMIRRRETRYSIRLLPPIKLKFPYHLGLDERRIDDFFYKFYMQPLSSYKLK